MEYHNNCSERLHLAKGEKNIYVDIPQLLQHQIEGIRFLYKQFTKKKNGVILNDPTDSGKTHQIVLFLNAIKDLLNKQPILILCGAHEKEHWMTHFQDFTDFGSGVLLEPANLNTKKMLVCVDTKSNLASHVAHHWSIVVIDDDSAVNEVLKKGFKTDFKIWMTSVDMKRNLEVFWSIYGWLSPKEKEMVQKIISKEEDKLAKLILIDAAMEDVVLKRVNGISPFKKRTKAAKTEIKLNRKNKDVSGTKTKRTKTQSNIEKPLKSKVIVPSVLDNVDKTFQSHDISNSNINRTDDDQVRQRPVIMDDNISIQLSEPKNEDEGPCDLNIPTSLKNKLEHDENNESAIVDDVTQETIDIQIKNEINETVTEKDKSVEDEVNAAENSNKLNESKVIENFANAKTVFKTENVAKIDATSIHKNIEETMKEMEEEALKKFKGSFLDSIF